MKQQAIAGKATSEKKTEAARKNARLPRGKRTEMPTMPINKLAELLLLEIQAAHRTIYGKDLKQGELRVNGWPISEIAERVLSAPNVQREPRSQQNNSRLNIQNDQTKNGQPVSVGSTDGSALSATIAKRLNEAFNLYAWEDSEEHAAQIVSDGIRELREENERLRKTLIFVRDECDWETPRGDFGGGGDDRIGPAITSALANDRDARDGV